MDEQSAKQAFRTPWLVTTVSLVVAFALAYGLDVTLQRLRESAGASFQFRYPILLSSIIPPIIIAGSLALAWLVLRFLPPNWFTAIAFLVAGLFVMGEYLSIFIAFPVWLRPTIIGKFRYRLMDLGSQSAIYYLASGWVIIGIAALRRLAVTPRDTSPEM